MGRAIFHEALKHTTAPPDPNEFTAYQGSGVRALFGNNEIFIGNRALLEQQGIPISNNGKAPSSTQSFMAVNKKNWGALSIEDMARPEAAQSMDELRILGIQNIIMLTGDTLEVAERVAKTLHIQKFHASMKPEEKLREIEKLLPNGTLVMVGDGINDAPALARADVGIAMGGGGTAVAVEAANIVILTDDLSRLPELLVLGKRTMSVIRGDVVIWFLSNLIGFSLVLTGVAGPALAAFYNFATDFLPLLNSVRLFRTHDGIRKQAFRA